MVLDGFEVEICEVSYSFVECDCFFDEVVVEVVVEFCGCLFVVGV